MDMNIVQKSFTFGNSQISFETGRIARQAHGAVLASMDDTQVLVSVVGAKEAKPGQSFFPLSVDYIEKIYAAGKIPGGFLKREGIGPLLDRFPFSKVMSSPFLLKP